VLTVAALAFPGHVARLRAAIYNFAIPRLKRALYGPVLNQRDVSIVCDAYRNGEIYSDCPARCVDRRRANDCVYFNWEIHIRERSVDAKATVDLDPVAVGDNVRHRQSYNQRRRDVGVAKARQNVHRL
jgi:hypothetical protein